MDVLLSSLHILADVKLRLPQQRVFYSFDLSHPIFLHRQHQTQPLLGQRIWFSATLEGQLLPERPVSLDLQVIIPGFLVLRQLFFEEQQLRVGEVDEETQGDIKQLPVVAVVSQDGQEVTLHYTKVPQRPKSSQYLQISVKSLVRPSDLVVGVVPPEEPDEVLHTLHTLGVRVVGGPVIDAQAGAGRLNRTIRSSEC